MSDIQNRSDIQDLVDSFYQKLLGDEKIAFIFTDHAKIDLEHHMPIMYDFWESILLNSSSYKGNVMLKHIDLNKKVSIEKSHLMIWLSYWEETINEKFEGPVAEEAIKRARLMGDLMMYKMDQSNQSGFIQ